MASDIAQLAALDDHGNGLRVVFTKYSDRWKHQIERVSGGAGTPVLQSSEGSATDDWPLSPPFQELSQETLPDGRTVIFLVGRAGTSHWSASVETAHDPSQLVFDIACRHTQVPQILGSAYERLTPDAHVEALLGQCTEAAIKPNEVNVRLPGTTRWKYRIA